MWRKWERLQSRDVKAPDLTDAQLQKGKRTVCPCTGRKRLSMPYTRGWRHSWEGAGGYKFAGHTCLEGHSSALEYTAGT